MWIFFPKKKNESTHLTYQLIQLDVLAGQIRVNPFFHGPKNPYSYDIPSIILRFQAN